MEDGCNKVDGKGWVYRRAGVQYSMYIARTGGGYKQLPGYETGARIGHGGGQRLSVSHAMRPLLPFQPPEFTAMYEWQRRCRTGSAALARGGQGFASGGT